MNGQTFAPFQTSYCSICTQKHGPQNHSDKLVSQALCKGGTPQDDMKEDSDAGKWASSPA